MCYLFLQINFIFFIISEHNLLMKNNSVFRYFLFCCSYYYYFINIFSFFYIVYVVNSCLDILMENQTKSLFISLYSTQLYFELNGV